MNDFKTTVKEKRLALGISMAKMARKLGIAYTTLWRWETGRSQPPKGVRGLWAEKIGKQK
jgi:transcriptional regulator with XRE-family HTH domain